MDNELFIDGCSFWYMFDNQRSGIFQKCDKVFPDRFIAEMYGAIEPGIFNIDPIRLIRRQVILCDPGIDRIFERKRVD
jgi:hypothetical protein